MFKNNFDIILVIMIQMLIPKESNSFIQVNGTNYFIAYRNKYLIINLFGAHLSNNTKINKIQVMKYDNEYFKKIIFKREKEVVNQIEYKIMLYSNDDFIELMLQFVIIIMILNFQLLQTIQMLILLNIFK